VTAQQAPAPRSDQRYTALDLRPIPKALTQASAAAAPPVKLPNSDPSAAIVKVVFRHLFSKWSVLRVACTTAGSEWSQYKQSSSDIQGVAGLRRWPDTGAPTAIGTFPAPELPALLPATSN
jgi:hypothetical protein